MTAMEMSRQGEQRQIAFRMNQIEEKVSTLENILVSEQSSTLKLLEGLMQTASGSNI